MKYTPIWIGGLVLIVCSCSSEPQTTTQPPKPAEARAASNTNADAVMIAEYLVFTHLADSLIYKPLNDQDAMRTMASQIDFAGNRASTDIMQSTIGYLHKVLSDAQLPLQQFAGSMKSPEMKAMADRFLDHLQQTSNQYFRALRILEEAGDNTSSSDVMRRVGLVMQGTDLSASKLRFEAENRAVVEAARRTLGL